MKIGIGVRGLLVGCVGVLLSGSTTSWGALIPGFDGIKLPEIKVNWPGRTSGEPKPNTEKPPEKEPSLPATIEAAEQRLAEAKEKDKGMWRYVLGAMYLRKGDYTRARAHLTQALEAVDARFGKDRNAARARNYLRSESSKNFLGEPYERSMANFYMGVLEWMNGDINAARPYFKNAQWEDSFTGGDSKYACDYVLFDYLWGLGAVKMDADPGNSLELARAVTNTVLVGNHSAPPLPDYNRKANVLVIAEYGLGPFKYRTGSNNEMLRFKGTQHPTVAARLKLANATHLMPPFDDVTFQAMTRGGRLMDGVNRNKAIFNDAAGAVGAAALATSGILMLANVDERAALIVMGVGLALELFRSAGIIKPGADIRCWYNLPQFLSFQALELPPGSYSGKVEFLDERNEVLPGQTKAITFTVDAGSAKDVVLFVSELNN